MSDKRLTWLKFTPGDWMKDPAVRSCSLTSRGLWIDMLCLMHESPRRGYLQLGNGNAVSAAQLARMTGCATDDVPPLLLELETAEVFSRTAHGVIYNRRMVRDEAERIAAVAAGKLGGNPALRGDKGGDKGHANPPHKPRDQSSEFRDKKKDNDDDAREKKPPPPPNPATEPHANGGGVAECPGDLLRAHGGFDPQWVYRLCQKPGCTTERVRGLLAELAKRTDIDDPRAYLWAGVRDGWEPSAPRGPDKFNPTDEEIKAAVANGIARADRRAAERKQRRQQ